MKMNIGRVVVWNFEHLNFDIVSDFEIRILIFRIQRPAKQ